ncbi:MAG: hypothetical protein NC098_03240 [Lachnoclostridium sp.]|nr:hypothetical protein [Lachnoclostridium sp.]
MRDFEKAVSEAYYQEIIDRIQSAFDSDMAYNLCSAVFAFVTGGDEMEFITSKMEWKIFVFIREDLLKAIERSRKARQPRRVEDENVPEDENNGDNEKKMKRRARRRRIVPDSIKLMYKMMDQMKVPEEERDPNWVRYVKLKDYTW